MNRPDLLAGEDLPAAPRQKRSIEKRVRLKRAALELFGSKGFEKTSVEEIAERAGMAVGAFYQHYRSKQQLLLALMNELLEALSRLDLRPGAGPGGVRLGLRNALAAAFARDLQYLGAYRAWQEAALSDPDLEARQVQIRQWTTARVAMLLTGLAKIPGARRGVNIPPLARALDSYFWTLLAQAGRMSPAELDEWIDSSTHLVYHAMFADP